MLRSDETYLTEAEVRRLTGRVYPSRQRVALAREKWSFAVDADGRPLVLRVYHDERMGVKPVRRKSVRVEGLASA